jgi:hypothetical protein
LIANQTTFFFLVSEFSSGAYSEKLLIGTRQRFSGFSLQRQCGEEVLRTLVTGGPPVPQDEFALDDNQQKGFDHALSR